jgi:hypothetical protein
VLSFAKEFLRSFPAAVTSGAADSCAEILGNSLDGISLTPVHFRCDAPEVAKMIRAVFKF